MAETDELHPDNIDRIPMGHGAFDEDYCALYAREQKVQARLKELEARIEKLAQAFEIRAEAESRGNAEPMLSRMVAEDLRSLPDKEETTNEPA